MNSICSRCGREHIDGQIIKGEKERVNYSWRDLANALHYTPSYVRAVYYKHKHVTCRFNATWREFIAVAKPLPVNRWFEPKDISLLQVGPELVKQRSSRRSHESGQWAVISTNRLAMKWHWFKCEHCGEWYIGVHKQKYCLKEACVKFRKSLRAIHDGSIQEQKPQNRAQP